MNPVVHEQAPWRAAAVNKRKEAQTSDRSFINIFSEELTVAHRYYVSPLRCILRGATYFAEQILEKSWLK